MRSLILFAVVLYGSSAVTGEKAENALSMRGYEQITLCMTEYTRLAGKPIADEIDRVYIHVFKNLDGLLFTKGAVGTFGKRSPTYASWLGCAVKKGEIVSLKEPFTRILVRDSGNEVSKAYKEYHEGTVIELLYLRDGDRFEFCCSQPFDEKNIDKHNPDRKRQLLDALRKNEKRIGPP